MTNPNLEKLRSLLLPKSQELLDQMSIKASFGDQQVLELITEIGNQEEPPNTENEQRRIFSKLSSFLPPGYIIAPKTDS